MPKYVIERDVPGASNLTRAELTGISQTAGGVLWNLICKIMVALAAIGTFPPLSFAVPTSISCTSAINGTVNANVFIPNGAQCVINPNATINGNVSVGSGAMLLVGQGVTINRNLEAAQESLVLMGPGSTLNGSYGANGAITGILESHLAQNVSFNGGSYAILGNVVGNITCGGSASGAISTAVGVLNTGCPVGDPVAVLSELGAVADKAGSSGSGGKLTCDQIADLAIIYATAAAISNAACDAGGGTQACTSAANFSGQSDAYTNVYNSNCTTIE